MTYIAECFDASSDLPRDVLSVTQIDHIPMVILVYTIGVCP